MVSHIGTISLMVVLGMIPVLGTVANSLSLTYFIKTRRNRQITISRLFILLNTFDLMVCISGTAELLSNLWKSESSSFASRVLLGILLTSVQLTWFCTCLLAITRAINITLPLHFHINWKIVNVATAIYGLIALSSGVLQVLDHFPEHFSNAVEDKVEVVEFILLAVMYFLILVSNIVCVVMIYAHAHRAENSPWEPKREATVTVLILSVCFLLLNTGFMVRYGMDALQTKSNFLHFPFSFLIFDRVLLLLNSAVNPVVYFFRNTELRLWLTTLGRNALNFFTGKRGSGPGPTGVAVFQGEVDAHRFNEISCHSKL